MTAKPQKAAATKTREKMAPVAKPLLKKSPSKKASAKQTAGTPPTNANNRRTGAATRSNRRSEKTIDQILKATVEVLMARGTSKLFVREVCDKVGISRGTLYRYFASKEELLDAVVTHMREGTDRNMNNLMETYSDPDARFAAFLQTLSGKNFEVEESTRLLEAEPVFLLNYMQGHFEHFTDRMDRTLAPIYDTWDSELGAKVDRPLLNEIFVRLALSKTLVPATHDADNVLSRIGDMIQLLRGKSVKPRRLKAAAK